MLVSDLPEQLHSLSLRTAAGRIEVTARSREAGEARESMAAGVAVPEVEVTINARLPAEGPRRLGEGRMHLTFSGPESMLRFRLAEDQAGPHA